MKYIVDMKEIIPRVDRRKLKAELTDKIFIRPTNKGGNKIYITDAHRSPNIMREIGRLREMSFRSWGGGTGEEIDTDDFDFLPKPFKQLIVWDPEEEEIVGGYRFIEGRNAEVMEDGQPRLVMSNLFTFSQEFLDNYLDQSIELGRAFVQPIYQTAKMGVKSLFALDNLWDGLGALVHRDKRSKYFIGKVNIYKEYPKLARELLYEYMALHCPDPDRLVYPKVPIEVSEESKKIARIVLTEKTAAANYKNLQKIVRNIGTTVPPMFNAYIGLTDTLKMFGTMIDPDFSGTYESAIMLTMDDLIISKKERYIEPYKQFLRQKLNERRAAKRAEKIVKYRKQRKEKAKKREERLERMAERARKKKND